MKTKDLVKAKSRELFNKYGVKNVALRTVAEKLNKSYGNITYYYSTKEQLIFELFDDMNKELSALQLVPFQTNLLEYFLSLPSNSYDITLKYLFFSIDYVELQRNYPEFFKQVEVLNEKRKHNWLELLKKLREDGYLHEYLTEQELAYIMLLSASVRTFYFQSNSQKKYNKAEYINVVNQLLKPYLSSKGLAIYESEKHE